MFIVLILKHTHQTGSTTKTIPTTSDAGGHFGKLTATTGAEYNSGHTIGLGGASIETNREDYLPIGQGVLTVIGHEKLGIIFCQLVSSGYYPVTGRQAIGISCCTGIDFGIEVHACQQGIHGRLVSSAIFSLTGSGKDVSDTE